MDFGKYVYEEQKKHSHAKTTASKIKEIEFSARIAPNDFNTKLRHAEEFLDHGNKVKLRLKFRGREMAHTEIGFEVIKKRRRGARGHGASRRRAQAHRRNIHVMLTPLPANKRKAKFHVKGGEGARTGRGPSPASRTTAARPTLRACACFSGTRSSRSGGTFLLSRADYEAALRAPPAARALRPARPGPPRDRHRPRPRGRGPRDREPVAGVDGEDLHARCRDQRLKEAPRGGGLQGGHDPGDPTSTSRSRSAPRSRTRRSSDLFVSIHFNSLYPNTKTTGVEVLSFPPSRSAPRTRGARARRTTPRPADAPINAFNAWNTVLAGSMHRRLLDALQNGDRGEKLEHLGVLRAQVPGSPGRAGLPFERLRGRRAWRRPNSATLVASAILAGIQDYAALIRSLRPLRSPRPAGGAPGPAAAPAARSQPTRPAPGP
jgi:hypothetical protein